VVESRPTFVCRATWRCGSIEESGIATRVERGKAEIPAAGSAFRTRRFGIGGQRQHEARRRHSHSDK
jgi:hypothetical protein